jgi:multiple antibiotic resistance protein
MLLDFLTSAFVTLLVTVDPPGLAPIFLALTPGASRRERARIAVRAVTIAFCVTAGFAVVGDWLLRQLGISLPAFRIAGGLLLFWLAFDMIFQIGAERKTDTAEQAMQERFQDLAAFPLAIPLMAGPGAITATLLIAGRTGGDPLLFAILLATLALVMAACLASFLLAERIDRLIGRTGNLVLTRLLGVVLAALAVQFVIDGVLAIRA